MLGDGGGGGTGVGVGDRARIEHPGVAEAWCRPSAVSVAIVTARQRLKGGEKLRRGCWQLIRPSLQFNTRPAHPLAHKLQPGLCWSSAAPLGELVLATEY